MFLASGLSFNVMVCLTPVLFLLVAALGFVLSRSQAADAVVSQLGQFVPVYKEEMRQLLGQVVRRRNLSSLLGTAVLLLFASQLFGSLRLVLNEVFGFREGPGIVHETLKDVLMLVVMGVLFLASIAITDLFGWLKILLMVPVGMPAEWIRSVFILLALGINTALFFVAYRYFPHRKVPAGAALAGAVLASVLWESAKQIFRWYILTFGVYDRLYGPLGALVGLSMFTYYSGIVFVFGAEFAAALRRGARG